MNVAFYSIAGKMFPGFSRYVPSSGGTPPVLVILADSREQASLFLETLNDDSRGLILLEGGFYRLSDFSGNFRLLELPREMTKDAMRIALSVVADLPGGNAIPEEEDSSRRIARLNSLLLAIRNLNQMIVQESDGEVLPDKACSILLEARGYRDCAIALINEQGDVTKLAQAGISSFPEKELLAEKLPRCMSQAVETGNLVTIQDVEYCKDCRFLEIHGPDFNPRIVTPLRPRQGEPVVGVLYVDLAWRAPPDDTELSLLQEAAMDIAFALDKLSSEKKLAHSEMMYRTLFESSQDAVMILEPPDWRYTSGNYAIFELFGIGSREEFLSLNPWNLSPEYQPDGRPSKEKALEMIETALENGSYFFHWTHKKIKGENFPSTVLLSRIDTPEGHFIQATVKDISVETALQEALQESEQKVLDITESVPGVIFQFHVSPENDYSLRFIRGKIRDLLGISPELDGFFDRFLERVHPDDLGLFRVLMEHSIRRKLPWEHEFRFIKPDGDIMWLKGAAMPKTVKEDTTFNGMLVDITRLKEIEDALRKERDYSSSIIESTPVMVFGISPEGMINFVNPACERATGYPAGKLAGRNCWKTLFPDDGHGRVEDLIARISTERHVRDFEMNMTTKSGEKRVISWNSICRTDEFDSITEILAFCFDITDRSRAERSLRESEILFRSVVENAPAGIFLMNVNSGIVFSNDRMCRLTGYHMDELLEMKIELLFEDGGAGVTSEWTSNACEGPIPRKSYKLVMQRKDGETRDVVVYVDSFLDAEGNCLILGEMMDVTETRRMERELLNLRRYLENIIDAMPSVLMGIDGNGTVTLWNSQAEKRTGISGKKAMGKPLAEVVPWLNGYGDLAKESIKTKKIQYLPKQTISDPGNTMVEDVTIFPLLTHGTDGAVIRIDDVTEKVRMENMVVLSEKMLSIGGLAAGMAHEINNPLAGMMQNAEVILRRLLMDTPRNDEAARRAGTTMETVRKFLEQRGIITQLKLIHESGTRAATIVRNMLNFARKGDSTPSPVDLRELMDQTIELAGNDYDLKKKFDFKQVRIVRKYDTEMEPVPCERSKIQQVFLNILKNGTEAMHEAHENMGKPERPTFTIGIHEEDDYAVVEIEDNGPGISEEVRRRIFEPFFTTKDVGTGTGLGLSVSYFIITEEHGGKLEVESVPGSFTKFTVKLPRAKIGDEAHRLENSGHRR